MFSNNNTDYQCFGLQHGTRKQSHADSRRTTLEAVAEHGRIILAPWHPRGLIKSYVATLLNKGAVIVRPAEIGYWHSFDYRKHFCLISLQARYK